MKKYVKITEKDVKRGDPDVYHGFITKQNAVEIEAIYQGPERDDCLQKGDFSLADWFIEPCKKEEVIHYFKGAVITRDKKLLDAEFELEHQNFKKSQEQEYMKLVTKEKS